MLGCRIILTGYDKSRSCIRMTNLLDSLSINLLLCTASLGFKITDFEI